MPELFRWLIVSCCSLALLACGGGGGSEPLSSQNPAARLLARATPAAANATTGLECLLFKCDGPPAGPANMSVSVTTSTSIDLTWTDSSANEEGFYLYRWVGNNWVRIATLEPGKTSYQDSGLGAGTSYLYFVQAFNNAGISNLTQSPGYIAVSTQASTNITKLANGYVRHGGLTWMPIAARVWYSHAQAEALCGGNIQGQSGWRLPTQPELSALYAAHANSPELLTDQGWALAYTWASTPSAVFGHYGVYFLNGVVFTSSDSDIYYVTCVNAQAVPDSVPAPPASMSGSAATDTSISLSWVDSSADEQGFRLFRRVGDGWLQIATLAPGSTSHTDSGLLPGTSYLYFVQAFNAVGNSNLSQDPGYISVATLASAGSTARPTAPATMAANPSSSTTVDLSWSDNSSNEWGFWVYRWVAGNWFKIADLGTGTTALTDASLTPGTSYLYFVQSYNGAGASNLSQSPGYITVQTPASSRLFGVDSFGQSVEVGTVGNDGGFAQGDAGVDGTAGEGAPIVNGTVVVVGLNGVTATAKTNSEGYYRVNVTKLTLPFVVKVTRMDGREFHSLNVAPLKRNGFVTVNITGLTDKIASDVQGGLASLLTPQKVQSNSTAIANSINALQSLLNPVITNAGLSAASFDPIGTPFRPDRTGYDLVLENTQVVVDAAGKTQVSILDTFGTNASVTVLQGVWQSSVVNQGIETVVGTVAASSVLTLEQFVAANSAPLDPARYLMPTHLGNTSNTYAVLGNTTIVSGPATNFVYRVNSFSYRDFAGCSSCDVGSQVSFVLDASVTTSGLLDGKNTAETTRSSSTTYRFVRVN